ncbi:MAG: hypothetical protein LBR80_16180, partial [Deltaproteobacteria bacterium]|nr:hypothetical protein [Deltaproteobacteria bacterium]
MTVHETGTKSPSTTARSVPARIRTARSRRGHIALAALLAASAALILTPASAWAYFSDSTPGWSAVIELPIANSEGPDKSDYQTSPIMSAGKTVPQVLLVLSKDHKLFQQAYNELTDMDGDGRVDTGFNPSVEYYGYFDSRSCYKYQGSIAYAAEATAYFERVGATKDDQSQSALDSDRPQAVKDANIPAVRAVHFQTKERLGICNDPHTTQSGNFSGNWLNFVTATRMDVVRKILYGGYRMTDTNAKTRLQSSMVPRDAHTWGTDVVADNRWASETAMTKYYDISKYTPYPKPAAGKAHFFARTRNYTNATPFPVVEYILNAEKGTFKTNINVTGTGGRYYDWVLNDAPNPSSANLVNPGGVIRTFTVQVDVCVKDNFGEGEGCRTYPNGNLKPAGLLQQNGENGQMLFGLLTGSYTFSKESNAETAAGNTRHKGGVVRSHINDLTSAIDLNTGILKAGGLIRNIDSLTISGNPTPTATGYDSARSWGNPVGEMLYEAVRYMQRLAEGKNGSTQPTSAFVPANEDTYNTAALQAPFLKTWADLPALPGADCSKPVILLIAESDSDFDGDTAVNTAGGINRPLLANLPASLNSGLPNSFNKTTYLDKITAAEGLATDVSGEKWFYSSGNMSDCSPKSLTSLTQVNGLCPSLPSYEGTYTSAAVAYYGHTHNFGASGSPEQSVDVYAVAMSGGFPPLEFPVYGSSGKAEKRISIIPSAMSNRDAATTVDRILGLLNYFILDWQTDSRGTPYHVKIRVNFEDAFQSNDKGYGASDWDSDLLIEYTIDLVSSSKLSKSGSVSFNTSGNSKISGALKVKGGTYYTFKYPYDQSFVIEPNEVAGVFVGLWKYMNSAGVIMMGGYSIGGSTRDGVYMDIGHHAGMDKYATPSSCNWPKGYGGASADNGTNCKKKFGTATPMSQGDSETLKVWRTFEFDPNPDSAGSYLPGPLYLAAKYGGFNDFNRNGIPDPGEFEGANGVPKNYFQAANISQLPAQLQSAFRDIARSISTGTATSASVDTVQGGGVSVQTVYYPTYVNPNDSTQQVRWVGSVFGLFVDRYGNYREDYDRDGLLTPANGTA